MLKVFRHNSVILFLILTLILGTTGIISLSSTSVAFADDVDYVGEGTEDSPYEVDSYEKLIGIAEKAYETYNTHVYFKQTADIDMTTIDEHSPISSGNYSFDGNHHKIYGFSNTADVKQYEYGLFYGISYGSEVKNVNLEVDQLYLNGNAGPLAYYNDGTITNVNVSRYNDVAKEKNQIVLGKSGYSIYNIGGIVGQNYGTIQNSSTDLTFAVNPYYGPEDIINYLGGITGYSGYYEKDYYTSEEGNLIGNESSAIFMLGEQELDYIGGIVGYAYDSNVTDNTFTGEIQAPNGYSIDYLGGVVGYAYYSPVTDNTFTGEIQVPNGYSIDYLGGVVGYAYYSPVTGNTSSGEINASNMYSINNTGGIVGYAYYSLVAGNTSSGEINASNAEEINDISGIVGDVRFSDVSENTFSGELKTSGAYYLGGIVGYSEGSLDYSYTAYDGFYHTINGNKNTGKIYAYDDVKYFGGIVGYNDNMKVENNIYNGQIEASDVEDAGGIAGYIGNSSLLGNTSKGSISIANYLEHVGGIAGYAYSSYLYDNISHTTFDVKTVYLEYGGYMSGILGYGEEEYYAVLNNLSFTNFGDLTNVNVEVFAISGGEPWVDEEDSILESNYYYHTLGEDDYSSEYEPYGTVLTASNYLNPDSYTNLTKSFSELFKIVDNKVLHITDPTQPSNNNNGGGNGNGNGLVVTPTPEPTPTPSAPAPVLRDNVKTDGLAKKLESLKAPSEGANPAPAPSFSDTAESWAANAIKAFTKLGVVEGYGDGTFKPEGNITRAEFATIITRIFDIAKGNNTTNLQDVNNHWSANAVNTLVSAGILNGYPDGTFKPNNTITRQEMIVILLRVADISKVEDKANNLKAGTASGFAADALALALAKGIIATGTPDNYDPKAPATRAESLATIFNILNLNPALKALLEELL